LRGSGSAEDFGIVEDFLAQTWRFDTADPRGFDHWLRGQGLEAKKLLPIQVVDQKRLYGLDQVARIEPTKRLIEAFVNSPHASDFFDSIGRFSTDLRLLVYQTAVRAYRTEGIAYALAALSQESQWILDEATKYFADAPILRAFTSFTMLKSARVCLGLRADRIAVPCGYPLGIDQLFCMATNPPDTIATQLEEIGEANKAKLLQISKKLMETLPDRGFGQFAKVNLSLFICSATSDKELFEVAENVLISTAEPAVAELLKRLGSEYVESELQRVNRTFQPGQERFVAALVDAWRRICGDSIGRFEDGTRAIKVKAPVIAIAVDAGIAQKSEQHEERFRRLLSKGLQKAGDQTVREWLLRNPEFVKYLAVGRASLQTVRAVLDAARADPVQALALSSQLLDEFREAKPLEYWEEALRTLAAIGGPAADTIFRTFVTRRVRAGEAGYIRDVVVREPAATLLRRNIQPLLESALPQEWPTLFGLFQGRAAESTLMQLLEPLFLRGGSLGDWIVATLIPNLVVDGSLSPEFLRGVRNTDMCSAIGKALSTRVLRNIEDLRQFRDAWIKKRTDYKIRLLSRVQCGLRVAIKTAASQARLHEALSRAVDIVQEWATASPGAVDPVIMTAASVELPPPLQSEDDLRELFAHRVPSSLEFTLTVAANPWVIDAVLQQRGPWPKAEILLRQIVDRYVHVASVRRRADKQLEGVLDAVRGELATVLRGILSDIESELAGYFAFRDILDQNGLHPVMNKLGVAVEQRELSSEKHKIIRDPAVRGRLRVFGLGIKVDDRVVSSGVIMNSGDDDDCD
jgi:hypothetical protein